MDSSYPNVYIQIHNHMKVSLQLAKFIIRTDGSASFIPRLFSWHVTFERSHIQSRKVSRRSRIYVIKKKSRRWPESDGMVQYWLWGNHQSLYTCMVFESMAVYAVSVLHVCCTWLHRESLHTVFFRMRGIVGLACHIILCELLEGSWECVSLNSFCPEQGCSAASWVQTTLSYWFMLISSFMDSWLKFLGHSYFIFQTNIMTPHH